jgi:hypothetical protein
VHNRYAYSCSLLHSVGKSTLKHRTAKKLSTHTLFLFTQLDLQFDINFVLVHSVGSVGLSMIYWAQERDRWRYLVNTVMNLWVP